MELPGERDPLATAISAMLLSAVAPLIISTNSLSKLDPHTQETFVRGTRLDVRGHETRRGLDPDQRARTRVDYRDGQRHFLARMKVEAAYFSVNLDAHVIDRSRVSSNIWSGARRSSRVTASCTRSPPFTQKPGSSKNTRLSYPLKKNTCAGP